MNDTKTLDHRYTKQQIIESISKMKDSLLLIRPHKISQKVRQKNVFFLIQESSILRYMHRFERLSSYLQSLLRLTCVAEELSTMSIRREDDFVFDWNKTCQDISSWLRRAEEQKRDESQRDVDSVFAVGANYHKCESTDVPQLVVVKKRDSFPNQSVHHPSISDRNFYQGDVVNPAFSSTSDHKKK